MPLNFSKKILTSIQKIFFAIFIQEDQKTIDIERLTLSKWGLLARPVTHNDNTLSVFDYNNRIIRDGIFLIKNKRDIPTLTSMCQIVADILPDELYERSIMNNFVNPIIISIPSSRNHILKRGYNPSDIIAKEISKLCAIPYEPKVLLKHRVTAEQKTLRRYERLRNIKNSMIINSKAKERIEGRCIIVIDDIMTTGATFKEAKRVLLKNGAEKVMGVVLAH